MHLSLVPGELDVHVSTLEVPVTTQAHRPCIAYLTKGMINFGQDNPCITSQFKQNPIFVFSLMLTHLIHFISNKVGKTRSIGQNFAIVGTMIPTGFLFWQFRIFQLKNRFEKMSDFIRTREFGIAFDNARLNFGLYLGIGILFGAAISTIVLRYINVKKHEP